ncbi:MAG: aldehyde ferredoxin oxidoreductase family protein [Halarsenatibacteraceae bacterium]
MYGWTGKILEISLEDKSYREISLDEDYYLEFLGGRGLGVRLFLDYAAPSVDPLSKDNPIIFAAGPLTGTVIPSSGRLAVISKSPQTGTIFDSNAGGFWGAELKQAGYDAIIIRGELAQLSRLEINSEGVRFIEAAELKNMQASSTWTYLKQSIPGYRHIYIGPAGENLVRFSSITVGENRNFGRGGLGSVLGSKNIKAISIKGNQKVEIHDQEQALKIRDKAADWLEENPVTSNSMNRYGTSILVNLVNEAGILPTKNFQETQFPNADKISGESLERKTVSSKSSCYNCPIICSRKLKTSDGEDKSSPEYESLGLLGANLGIDDLDKVNQLNHLCNQLGLDTISTGSVLAAYIEMAEKSLIDADISFGDGEKIEKLINKIAFREGIGSEMAAGAKEFASSKGHPELAMQVKGLDLPAFDPRGMKGQALGYMTSNRGACHIRANMMNLEIFADQDKIDRYSEEGKAALLIEQQDFNAILDSLIVCKFTLLALAAGFYQEMLEAVTGLDFNGKFFEIGSRIWNLERMINVSAGFTRDDDYLPDRFSSQGGSGPSKDSLVNQDKLLNEYYDLRGWNNKGQPKENLIKDLNLTEIAHKIELDIQ